MKTIKKIREIIRRIMKKEPDYYRVYYSLEVREEELIEAHISFQNKKELEKWINKSEKEIILSEVIPLRKRRNRLVEIS